ncbi:hypothetical protein [Radiobacillus sp. PE A8.2]|uniref:hypothetical protein n=1 Tax=Radiobacillus sp. PE A8.2 TaxID=3380349 RepID=UPI00388D14E7
MDRLCEIAKKNNISRQTYRYRIKIGWNPDQAATTPVMSKKEVRQYALERRKILNAKEHKKINNDPDNLFRLTPQHIAGAEKRGICKATVQNRVYSSGWTVKDAITIPTQKTKKSENPNKYEEYKIKAVNNGVSKSAFTNRIGKLGWTFEKAASTPMISKNVRRRTDKEWINKAIKNNIKYDTYIKRIKRGWTPEEAATTPPLANGKYLNDEKEEKSRIAFDNFRYKKVKK